MKKSFIYGIVLTTALFSGCKGDYDDWAAPQGFDPEEAKNINVNITPAGAIDMENVTTETIQLFTASIDAPEGMEVTAYETVLSKVDENGVTQGKTVLTADASGYVSTKEVVNTVESYYGKNPLARKLAVTVVAYIKQVSQEGEALQAFCVNSNQVEVQVTLVKPDISEAYYLVGDMAGWDAESMLKFNHSDVNVYDDPVFTISFTTTEENQYWKIIPQSNIDADDFWVNPGVVGVKVDGDDSMSGQLVNENAAAGKIANPGKYNMTINMLDYTYEITVAPTELYITGSNYDNWQTWKQLTPIHSAEGEYWMISYFTASEVFKFAPQAGWSGGDFGGEATLNDEAGSDIHADGTNLMIDNAGWYLLHVVNGVDRVVNVLTPNVYLIGNTVGVWEVADANKFTIPEDPDGEFVSPAFVASDEVRMCVSFGGYDWWKTEFIVLNGTIVYRGTGDDQERVNVSEGQKAYLNFMTGTGSFK